MHTFYTNLFGVFISPIVIFFSGLILCFLAFKIRQSKQAPLTSRQFKIPRSKWYLLLLFLIFAIVFSILYIKSIQKFEINPVYSDVIPTLKNYNLKLLNGDFPYEAIQYPGWTVYPNYLTFQWLPYIIPELLNIDYRFFALIIFYFAVLTAFIFSYQENWSIVELFVKILYPFVLLWLFKDHHPDVFGYTTELTIASFYMFFSLAIFSKKWFWLILASSLCLYSRFSFIFLLPFFALFFYYQNGFKNLIIIVVGVIVIGMFVYVLPFMTQDYTIFTKGLSYYAEAAVGEWQNNSGEKYPFHLGRGFGFAVYFYDFSEGALAAKVGLSRTWHLALSVLSMLVLSLILFIKRKVLKDDSFNALLALKIYFLVFYAFIHVPYLYLQLVPLAISLVIFYKLNLTRLASNNEHELPF